MLATTGMYPGPDGRHPYPVSPALPVGVARSLVGSLDPTPDAQALGQVVESLDPASPDPLSRLRDAPCRSLGPAAAAAQALLVNRDPARFEELFAALPDAPRRVVESLSPLRSAALLSAPVEIATAPRDKYFPLAESLALQREVPAPHHRHLGARTRHAEADPQECRRSREATGLHRSLARRGGPAFEPGRPEANSSASWAGLMFPPLRPAPPAWPARSGAC